MTTTPRPTPWTRPDGTLGSRGTPPVTLRTGRGWRRSGARVVARRSTWLTAPGRLRAETGPKKWESRTPEGGEWTTGQRAKPRVVDMVGGTGVLPSVVPGRTLSILHLHLPDAVRVEHLPENVRLENSPLEEWNPPEVPLRPEERRVYNDNLKCTVLSLT